MLYPSELQARGRLREARGIGYRDDSNLDWLLTLDGGAREPGDNSQRRRPWSAAAAGACTRTRFIPCEPAGEVVEFFVFFLDVFLMLFEPGLGGAGEVRVWRVGRVGRVFRVVRATAAPPTRARVL